MFRWRLYQYSFGLIFPAVPQETYPTLRCRGEYGYIKKTAFPYGAGL